MKDVIYLTVDQTKVVNMTKSLPSLRHGQIPLRVEVIVDDQAFREPTLQTKIHITDWRQGMDFDVELREHTISEAEAEMIRTQRRARLIETLESQGYKIIPPEATDA